MNGALFIEPNQLIVFFRGLWSCTGRQLISIIYEAPIIKGHLILQNKLVTAAVLDVIVLKGKFDPELLIQAVHFILDLNLIMALCFYGILEFVTLALLILLYYENYDEVIFIIKVSQYVSMYII